jgi:uncharacterized protein YcaQ
VCAQLRLHGPLGNRDFAGQRHIKHCRGSKDTSLALYYLWLTGEQLVHHRQGFERVYDFREHIAPPERDYAAPEVEDPMFAATLARGLIRFAEFLEARRVDISVMEPVALREQVREHMDAVR